MLGFFGNIYAQFSSIPSRYQYHIVGRPRTFESLLGMLSTWSNCDAVKQIALRCWIRWWPRSPDGSVEDGWTFAAAHEWNLANPVGDQHGQVMTPWMTELVIIGDVNVMQRELTGLGAGIWLWRRTMHIVAVCAVFFAAAVFCFSVCLFICMQCSMFCEARVISATD